MITTQQIAKENILNLQELAANNIWMLIQPCGSVNKPLKQMLVPLKKS